VGTASLVSGIMLVLIGFATIGQALLANYFTLEQFFDSLVFNIIIGLPFIIVGALLLRKYDRDKKKEKEPIQNNVPEKEVELVKESEWSPKRTPILKGVIIGIIVALVIWGTSYATAYQTFIMTSDAMEPTIMKGDVMRYTKTPFNEIRVNDLIAFTDSDDSSRVLVNKVVRVYDDVVEVKNEESSIVRIVIEDLFIGKINSIEAASGLLSVFYIPYLLFFLMATAFVTPIVIMKIYGGRKSENS